jgi:hypothetical protein
MARNTDHRADDFDTENAGGVLSGFLAEEDSFDRRALWRLGSWGAATVGAVTLAVFANQFSLGWRRDQVAAADLVRQAEQAQAVAKESNNEARRLAAAIETLNGDRDRLYSRVTGLEQGLDSVTGAIARQTAAQTTTLPWPQQAPAFSPAAEPPMAANPPPAVAPVATAAAAIVEKPRPAAAAAEPATAAVASLDQEASNTATATPETPLMPARSMMAPPDPAASKLIEPQVSRKDITASPMPDVTASVDPVLEATETSPKLSLRRTEFGVDLGGANSVGGLRLLWRGLLKSKANAPLAALRPIIMVREGAGGLGLQLRLVAGPFSDAAAAAKICAALVESQRACETTVFDGQRLAMQGDEPPAAAKPALRKRAPAKRPVASDEPAKKPETSSTLSSLWKRSQ